MLVGYGKLEKLPVLGSQLTPYWSGWYSKFLKFRKISLKMTWRASYLQISHQSRSPAEWKPSMEWCKLHFEPLISLWLHVLWPVDPDFQKIPIKTPKKGHFFAIFVTWLQKSHGNPTQTQYKLVYLCLNNVSTKFGGVSSRSLAPRSLQSDPQPISMNWEGSKLSIAFRKSDLGTREHLDSPPNFGKTLFKHK